MITETCMKEEEQEEDSWGKDFFFDKSLSRMDKKLIKGTKGCD